MTQKLHRVNIEKDRGIISILGEICLGFKVKNFEEVIVVKKDVAESLLRRLAQEEKNGIVDTYLTDAEVEIIKRALPVVANEIEEWEFETRLGYTLEEIKRISIFNLSKTDDIHQS